MERILCAAIWIKDYGHPVHSPKNIKRGTVLCGYRHCDVIGQVVTLTGKRMAEIGDYEHGFITDRNRFVDREEAYNIAREANQLKPGVGVIGKWELYSEDLY